MSDMIQCPADGCDYSGLKDSVLGHYSGTRDDAHSGGYNHAKQKLNGELDGVDDGTGETSTDTANAGGGGGSPVMGNADPDDASGGESGESDGVSLPCGHDSYDPDDAPAKPFIVQCSDCEKKFKVTA